MLEPDRATFVIVQEAQKAAVGWSGADFGKERDLEVMSLQTTWSILLQGSYFIVGIIIVFCKPR